MSKSPTDPHQETPPKGYFDIIVTTEEFEIIKNHINTDYTSSKDSIHSKLEKQSTLSAHSISPDRQASDLVRYRIANEDAIFITRALAERGITRSSPQITAEAKAYFTKQPYSIVYFSREETKIGKILPEFSDYASSYFCTTDDVNGESVRLKTGDFSPFDVSCLNTVGVEKIIEVSNGPDKESLYCSTVALNVASTMPSEDESKDSATSPYELILTSEQLMRLRVELNHRQPLTRKTFNNTYLAVVCVNLTALQAEQYRTAFDLEQLSHPTQSPILLSSRAHNATHLPEMRDLAVTSRARCAFFTKLMAPSVMAPLVGLGNTLWVLNYLSPAFHQILPSALGMLLGATAMPYVLAILTALVLAAIWCEYNPIHSEASDDTATSSFSIC